MNWKPLAIDTRSASSPTRGKRIIIKRLKTILWKERIVARWALGINLLR
jgi:hypothetical protein